MTTSPSNSGGRRHRGRRGRRSGHRNPNQQPVQQQEAPDQEHLPESPVPEVVAIAVPDVPAEPVPAPQPHGPHHDPGPGDGRPRGDRNDRGPRPQGRRRQPPRQPVGPMPSEVLKRHVRVGAPEYPLQMRPVAGMVDEQGANFGCPMLQRNKTAMPATGNQRSARCSLGWSVHNEHEALYCMHTPDLLECWKAHPERIPVLDERIEAEHNVPQAAD